MKQMTTFMSRMEAVIIRREFIKFQKPYMEGSNDEDDGTRDNDNTVTEFPPEEAEDDLQDRDDSSEVAAEPQGLTVEVKRSVLTYAKTSPPSHGSCHCSSAKLWCYQFLVNSGAILGGPITFTARIPISSPNRP